MLLGIGFSVDVVGTWEAVWKAAITAVPAGIVFPALHGLKDSMKQLVL
ncbi:hypothetical protein [Xanthomarina sp. F2636L]|nr:hypothetical protein [Xanthomarina sp. F2636L]MCX7549474.1 hypothetical protein [Xanthomarina sp. F2636L]